jgi:hypothetical protein
MANTTGAPPAAAPVLPMDFSRFMHQLEAGTDPGRLANALRMLKAERFQLFSQVEPESLVGIVRSQSSGNRIYSCRLTSEGDFACCTQNLRHCGGLGGRLCKHILVMVVGLARSGRVALADVDRWVKASRSRRPILDHDVMTATFLRYKGAEAGEIDWRPTETIPEDFYAL